MKMKKNGRYKKYLLALKIKNAPEFGIAYPQGQFSYINVCLCSLD